MPNLGKENLNLSGHWGRLTSDIGQFCYQSDTSVYRWFSVLNLQGDKILYSGLLFPSLKESKQTSWKQSINLFVYIKKREQFPTTQHNHISFPSLIGLKWNRKTD
jgi:hypothetical protein